MTVKVTLMGAGGKMGCRITDRLREESKYDVDHVEPGKEGRHRLDERGIEPVPEDEAIADADAVILAVPDELIGPITESIVPKADPGTAFMMLDPAAAHAGVLHEREDVTYFLAHPAHPSFFTAETRLNDDDPDWFGGQGRDPQDVVCSLHQGPEEHYEKCAELTRAMYAPVRNVHRLTTEQMALLEPALVETVLATCLEVIREGCDTVVEKGVPEEAAREFLFGHMRIELGIIFGYTDFPFSDGAQQAMKEARDEIFKPDWKEKVFDGEQVEASTKRIASSDD